MDQQKIMFETSAYKKYGVATVIEMDGGKGNLPNNLNLNNMRKKSHRKKKRKNEKCIF